MMMIPIVICALGMIPKGLVKGLEGLEIGKCAEIIQTLLRLARMLRIPGDLRTLAVTWTSMKDHQLMPV